jgi:hypothetical protein
LAGLDVGLEDLCGFPVYSWGLNFVDVVLGESRNRRSVRDDRRGLC